MNLCFDLRILLFSLALTYFTCTVYSFDRLSEWFGSGKFLVNLFTFSEVFYSQGLQSVFYPPPFRRLNSSIVYFWLPLPCRSVNSSYDFLIL